MGSNNVFHFFEDYEFENEIKTISYQLDADGKVLGKWEEWNYKLTNGGN